MECYSQNTTILEYVSDVDIYPSVLPNLPSWTNEEINETISELHGGKGCVWRAKQRSSLREASCLVTTLIPFKQCTTQEIYPPCKMVAYDWFSWHRTDETRVGLQGQRGETGCGSSHCCRPIPLPSLGSSYPSLHSSLPPCPHSPPPKVRLLWLSGTTPVLAEASAGLLASDTGPCMAQYALWHICGYVHAHAAAASQHSIRPLVSPPPQNEWTLLPVLQDVW